MVGDAYSRQDGRPLYIERLGKVKAKDLRKVTTKERQLQNLVLEYERLLRERLPACSEAAGHPIDTSCTILDLKDASILDEVKLDEPVRPTSLAPTVIDPPAPVEKQSKRLRPPAPLFLSRWSASTRLTFPSSVHGSEDDGGLSRPSSTLTTTTLSQLPSSQW